MPLEGTITFPLTEEGLAHAEEELRQKRLALFGGGQPASHGSAMTIAAGGGPQAPSTNPAVILWGNIGDQSRTREILKLLPDVEKAARTPAELARLMRPDATGQELKKASVRAAILNARRVEKRLRAEGRIDRPVIVADYSRYDADDANRYYLLPEDAKAIAAL